MPYEFAENEFELEPEASSAHSGGPPGKLTGIGILDPPVPPRRPPGPIPALPASLFLRILGGLLLLGLTAGILFSLFAKR
ncbi:MAG: hypothetical protein DMG40_08110 [Acidobacteria bacterium]|nr:MAG: hypothetical protein DMG40_08110 [Acidobacteriota bacterium]